VSVVSPVVVKVCEACHTTMGAWVAQTPEDASTISIFTGSVKSVLKVRAPALKEAIFRLQAVPPLRHKPALLATRVKIFPATAVGAVKLVSYASKSPGGQDAVLKLSWEPNTVAMELTPLARK